MSSLNMRIYVYSDAVFFPQRQDWSVHKEECRCLQRVAPDTPTDSVMLMLRLVIKFRVGFERKLDHFIKRGHFSFPSAELP